MGELWRLNKFRSRFVVLLLMCLFNHNWELCLSLNEEGLALLRFREGVVTDPFGALSNWNDDDGLNDPCSWFGVECSEGKVVVLNLKDLCLGGTLAPELGNLIHVKSIILRNNSFYGVVPKEFGELKELEMLDLGFNNFSGTIPFDIGSNLSLGILLLDNNSLEGISPEIHELNILSELQVDESQLLDTARGTSCRRRSTAQSCAESGNVAKRSLLQVPGASNTSPTHQRNSSPSHSPSPSPAASPNSISLTPASSPAPSPDLSSPAPADPPVFVPAPTPSLSSPVPPPSASPAQSPPASIAQPPPLISAEPSSESPAASSKSNHTIVILVASIGTPFFILFVAAIIFLCRDNKVVTVKPWATGLSGQLQRAFVTGVPKLRRSELQNACEDFSNIIGSSSNGTIYKGTLSSGVEIAVVSTTVTSAKEWSKNFEAQFRKKVDTLSKVNHKNFVNHIGFCEEQEPFTRMMVFEYAPNGTLFEHLHIKEAEHLDWGARLRIAMGMAYCLEYMHQLNPPVVHENLNSSIVYLTEDYAAKISDFGFWHEVVATSKMGSDATELLDTPPSNPESNVYSFGVVLLEIITGRLPYSAENGKLVGWASIYLRGEQPCKNMVDPMLKSFQENELDKLCAVIASCIHPDPKQRPTMREVTAQLREITALGPDGAIPKLSPLWWAELEILSTEAS
ncbi:probable inactive receptor-like protein kinase At3g56050 [Macadamia integrifolia]|uniref:probable inactive receptor-like protein kinase At3g56050 n=1 Tax=Macadamia integrifolia TaxID=60698 RepID=UPI001C4EB0C2|nr:probable inactive receptor-like protein kinase At3g56050 [Macadamia integrifolia]XP_042509998.1 probable inactive receptor-like protein kinase At3g56050 [Macadamia integrifolia]